MLNSLPVTLLAGVVLGFLSGLGVGGGSLLVLWLTLVLGLEPETARSINLLFFIPSALSAALLRWKQAGISWRIVLPAATAGCVGAVIFLFVSRGMDTTLLKKLFGILLLAAGLRELLYKPKKKQDT